MFVSDCTSTCSTHFAVSFVVVSISTIAFVNSHSHASTRLSHKQSTTKTFTHQARDPSGHTMSAPNAAPQPQTQPPLLPTLLALLPVTSLPRAQANISLLSIHAEKWEVSDKIYISLESVLPSQRRTLRLRISTSTSSSTLPLNSTSSASGDLKGKTKQGEENKSAFTRGRESISLAYVSQPLSGKEYSEINVRGVVEVDMGGLSLLEDVEDFLRTMGFSYVPLTSPHLTSPHHTAPYLISDAFACTLIRAHLIRCSSSLRV